METEAGTGTGLEEDVNQAKEIPAGCLSIEDTEVLARLARRGHRLSGHLYLPCAFLVAAANPNPIANPASSSSSSIGNHRCWGRSRNLVFDLPGTSLVEEVVLLGGHSDCWDCGLHGCQGAHDDGQGIVLCLEVLLYLQRHGLRAKRTIRAVLFVDEEVRQSGARAYHAKHTRQSGSLQAAIETDMGVGKVCGFGFSGSAEGRAMARDLLLPALAQALPAPMAVDVSWSGHGVDISPLIDGDGVPGLLLRHEDSWWQRDYFHYHHTAHDTIDHVDRQLLHENFLALLAAVWTLANCDERLPHQADLKQG